VSLVGHITTDELRDSRFGLRPVEVMNGMGNRFLWVYVDRRKRLPDAEPMPEPVLTPLVRKVRDALTMARKAGTVSRTPEATELWADLYDRVASDDGPGAIEPLIARGEAHLLRLSLIYALMDAGSSGSSGCSVERVHLEAAWEVWRYC